MDLHTCVCLLCPPAAVVGTSSPSVWYPPSHPMGVFLTPRSILDSPGCPYASPSALTRPNSEACWKVSSLAMSFLLGCNCLLLLPKLRSWAGILLSSFCLDRAGGNVWSLLQEMFLCFFNLQNKAVRFFANAVLAVCVSTGFILAG